MCEEKVSKDVEERGLTRAPGRTGGGKRADGQTRQKRRTTLDWVSWTPQSGRKGKGLNCRYGTGDFFQM